MRNTISATIRSDEGFYVGDICYVLGNEIYYGVWGEKYNFREEASKTLSLAGCLLWLGQHTEMAVTLAAMEHRSL